ncbi:MAG: HEAT repeat domain-containing protein [Deltaproteobacteria bacterium]|nr:HEAT repeat domain-containing protein [Deltaproteobacteria bacterium]
MIKGDTSKENTLDRIEALDSAFRRSIINMFEGEIDVGEASIPELTSNLEDMDADVRADAAEAMGRIGSPNAAGALKALLTDGDGEVRTQAAVALIRIGDDSLFPKVVKSLRHEDPRVVLGAAVVLGRVADRRVVPNLVEAFQTNHEEVGAAIAWALGQCGDDASLPWLCTAVQQGFCVVNACEALGRIGSPHAADALLRRLHDAHTDVRAYAARSLGMLRYASDDYDAAFCAEKKAIAIAALAGLFSDAERKVRLCAAIALYELGDKSGQKQLSDEVDGLMGDEP